MMPSKAILLIITLVFTAYILLLNRPSSDNAFPSASALLSTKQIPIKSNSTIEQTATFENIASSTEKLIAPSNASSIKLIELADNCLNNINDSAERKIKQDDYITALELSAGSDDKLALYMQNSRAKNSENLDDIFLRSPTSANDRLLYDRQLALCSENFNQQYCHDELYDQAHHIDKDNAYLWYLIASIHLSQNSISDALEAIHLGNNKAYFNDYHFEKISFIEQSYQKNSGLSFNNRLNSAIEMTSTSLGINYTTLINFCELQLENIDVADSCLQMGSQLEQHSQTSIAYMMGLYLQQLNYRHYFKAELYKEIQQKLNKYHQDVTDNKAYHAMSTLMSFDERLGRTWLNAGLEKGEIFSIAQTINEAKIFSQDDNYQPCH